MGRGWKRPVPRAAGNLESWQLRGLRVRGTGDRQGAAAASGGLVRVLRGSLCLRLRALPLRGPGLLSPI